MADTYNTSLSLADAIAKQKQELENAIEALDNRIDNLEGAINYLEDKITALEEVEARRVQIKACTTAEFKALTSIDTNVLYLITA